MIASGGAATEPIVRLLVCLVIILALGRVVGALCRRIGLPVVIGEILAGIALGPSLLGLLPGDLDAKLFPLEVLPYLKLVAQLGLVLFMFIIGLEVDLDVIRTSGKRAVAISLTSIALPLILGMSILGPLLHESHSCVAISAKTADEQGYTPERDGCTSPEVTAKIEAAEQRAQEEAETNPAAAKEIVPPVGKRVDFLPFALFLGVSMCGTAFAVLARILAERQMFKIPLGMLLIACAAIDDIVAFSLLAAAAAVASGESATNVLYMLGKLVLFVAVLVVVVRPLLDRFVVRSYRETGRLTAEHLSLLFMGLLASAYITSWIGVHELIGAFLFGVIVPRHNARGLFHAIADRIDGVSVQLLLPVFFVVAGQGVNLTGLEVSDIGPTFAILAVACVGKFVGGAGAARLTGVPRRQAYAVGTMMNTRGLAELVILQVGRDAGVINDATYTMLVIMAVVTTAMAGPLLKLVYPDRWLQRDIAEAERQGLGAVGERTVILVDDPTQAEPLVDIAVAFGGARPTSSVTLVRFVPTSAGFAAVADSLAETQALRRRVEETGIGCTVISRASADPATDTVAEVRRIAPDAVIAGPAAEGLVQPVNAEGADVVIVRGAVDVSGGVAAPGGSGNGDRAALELAARLALHHDVPLALQAEGGRVAKQLRRLGVRLGTGGVVIASSGTDGPITVHAGARDRVNLVERLGAWRVGDVVEPLSTV